MKTCEWKKLTATTVVGGSKKGPQFLGNLSLGALWCGIIDSYCLCVTKHTQER